MVIFFKHVRALPQWKQKWFFLSNKGKKRRWATEIKNRFSWLCRYKQKHRYRTDVICAINERVKSLLLLLKRNTVWFVMNTRIKCKIVFAWIIRMRMHSTFLFNSIGLLCNMKSQSGFSAPDRISLFDDFVE